MGKSSDALAGIGLDPLGGDVVGRALPVELHERNLRQPFRAERKSGFRVNQPDDVNLPAVDCNQENGGDALTAGRDDRRAGGIEDADRPIEYGMLEVRGQVMWRAAEGHVELRRRLLLRDAEAGEQVETEENRAPERATGVRHRVPARGEKGFASICKSTTRAPRLTRAGAGETVQPEGAAGAA